MTVDHAWSGGHLMIRMEPHVPGRAARVVGSLTGAAVQVLLEAVESGVTALDLSEVDQVDGAAVQVLARLSAGRCSLIACPRWLAMWIDSAQRNPGRPRQGEATSGGPDGATPTVVTSALRGAE
jgi:hypothetical protein